MQYAILREEISNDPLGRGYSTMSDGEVANDLNTNMRSYERKAVSAVEVFEAVAPSEWDGLTDSDKQNVRECLRLLGNLDISTGTNLHDILWNTFGSGTTTRSNLEDLINDTRSRARELGLSKVYKHHVKHARKQLG